MEQAAAAIDPRLICASWSRERRPACRAGSSARWRADRAHGSHPGAAASVKNERRRGEGKLVRRAALLIDNPDLARRIAAMLAQKTEIMILHAPDRPDVLITDHLPSDVPVPTIFLGSQPETFAAREAGA